MAGKPHVPVDWNFSIFTHIGVPQNCITETRLMKPIETEVHHSCFYADNNSEHLNVGAARRAKFALNDRANKVLDMLRGNGYFYDSQFPLLWSSVR